MSLAAIIFWSVWSFAVMCCLIFIACVVCKWLKYRREQLERDQYAIHKQYGKPWEPWKN